MAVLAFWPLVMMLAVVVSIFVWSMDDPPWFDKAWIAGTILFAVGWALFLWDVWHNERVPTEKRSLWTSVLFFAGPYAMPFYFWHYVR